jgi:hypothetical protein
MLIGALHGRSIMLPCHHYNIAVFGSVLLPAVLLGGMQNRCIVIGLACTQCSQAK